MFINKITIQNFKSFQYEAINFFTPKDGNGLNIFVGENNSGKSTLFEAVDFLRNGPKISLEDLKNKGSENKEMFVEIEFVGNIKDLVEKFSIKKLDEYIDGADLEKDRSGFIVPETEEINKNLKNPCLYRPSFFQQL